MSGLAPDQCYDAKAYASRRGAKPGRHPVETRTSSRTVSNATYDEMVARLDELLRRCTKLAFPFLPLRGSTSTDPC